MDKLTLEHILNVLRRGTVTWSGRALCLKRARKRVWDGEVTAKGKRVFKLYWKCAKCEKWFRDEKELEVDHIIEVGSFNGDWNEYIERLYCEIENLQALCIICHSKKTSGYNAAMKFKRKSLVAE